MRVDGLRRLRLLPLLALGACAGLPPPEGVAPALAVRTSAERTLHALPPPVEPVPVAVYDFRDLTGQHKPNDLFTEYSRAVTQGAVNFLIEALQVAGDGRWFVVLERAGLDNLLQERQLIRSTREQYLGPDGQPLPPPPPLLYAAVLIEGGVVAYETNTLTGGFGARYLGIGGSTEYRHDRVTVSVRATSTQNGRVLRTVSATKSIYSAGLQGGVFKFVGLDELLEIEAGITANEPPQLAVRQAIEKAVYALILEGALGDVWSFADAGEAEPLLEAYLAERDGEVALASADPEEPGRLAPAGVRSRVRDPSPAARGPAPNEAADPFRRPPPELPPAERARQAR